MGLDALIRAGLRTAHALTADLQAEVLHEAWTGADGYGQATFAGVQKRAAIVEQRQRAIRGRDGEVVMTRARVLFLAPLTPQGADGRIEPIDSRDRLTLPDGTTGPILDVEGLMDPTTDAPYYAAVWLG